ncbi:RICIN domain-containing protein [Zooshikella harenae]|uniref:RICIN domain-containing protein n=1 Tax=Zooshikella harenae TaxID=2827238 RepID=A0ABS5ZCT2_9GAMM|nr:RICIN domain-containing protein [Zooshikella harenae]MBU2711815.1 RICIN domain-containing protein [Zooshikella harenae]
MKLFNYSILLSGICLFSGMSFSATHFEGLYQIINKHSGKALEVADHGEFQGANVSQGKFTSGMNQYWKILPVGEQQYKLVNALSQQVLDIANAGVDNGNNVQQWKDNNTAAQNFILKELDDGTYKIESKLTGKVIDVDQWSRSDGGNVIQWGWHGGNNQRWEIIPKGAVNVPMEGVYKITSKHSSKVLDVSEHSMEGAANIQQWTYGGGKNQQWKFLHQGGGYYKIKSVHSGLMLDVANAEVGDGVNIQQWHENGNTAQLFSLIQQDGSDNFLIRNKASGKVLDVTDWAIHNGANIQQWTASSQANQLWELEQVKNGDQPTPPNNCRQLVWQDEFNYQGKPDVNKWGYDTGGSGWGNNELQHYTSRKENAYVNGSHLVIQLRKEPFQANNYTSARLVTRGKGDWTYGRVEVKAKLPAGRGTWPAIWMLPTDRKNGGWPNSGEIDIMEYVGSRLWPSFNTHDS